MLVQKGAQCDMDKTKREKENKHKNMSLQKTIQNKQTQIIKRYDTVIKHVYNLTLITAKIRANCQCQERNSHIT